MSALDLPVADLPAMSTLVDIRAALQRVAELRESGFDLVAPEAGELARLKRGAELAIVLCPRLQDVAQPQKGAP